MAQLNVIEHEGASPPQMPGAIEPVNDWRRESVQAVDKEQVDRIDLQAGQHLVRTTSQESDVVLNSSFVEIGDQFVDLVLIGNYACVVVAEASEQSGGQAKTGLQRRRLLCNAGENEFVA